MITVDLIHSFYQYFYNKKYRKEHGDIEIKKSSAFINACNSFIKLLEKEYGNTVEKEFLYMYFLFHFDYWEQAITKSIKNQYSKNIQPSFILGKKAFERWLGRNTEFDWLIEKLPFVKLYDIRKNDLIEQLHTKHKIVVKKNGVDTEAPIKLAAYNTPAGFLNCIDMSTLYNHKSTICQGCKFQDDCKKTLKNLYPGIYIDRGY